MTFDQAISSRLEESGIWPQDVQSILELAKKGMPTMDDVWSRSTIGYNPVVLNVAWIAVKSIALEWIEENQPNAWYKPMFMA